MFSRKRGTISPSVLDIHVWMGDMRTNFEWRLGQKSFSILEIISSGMVCAWLVAAVPAAAQVAAPVRASDASQRLLSAKEGRAIVNVAWQQEQSGSEAEDCSHLVHEIYANAGFEYPYASSFEIYAGNENFARVKIPHPGDVIAWPGHVGIVVDPLQHSFYSLVRTGLEEQDYESAYWKSRGGPRFYRYRVGKARVLTAAKAPTRAKGASVQSHDLAESEEDGQTEVGDSNPNRPPKAVAEKRAVYGPPVLVSNPKETAPGIEIPASVLIATERNLPTREEVSASIAEVGEAQGSALQTDDLTNEPLPVVIFERFSVEKVEVKRDHGWAQVVIDSKALIGGGAAQVKHRREKIRWELRRTESGWETVTPKDRRYVPQDAAVKNLAEQLARLSASDAAAKHQEAVLRQEAQLANLLNALLESRQDR
jgi:NlpC/P60 family